MLNDLYLNARTYIDGETQATHVVSSHKITYMNIYVARETGHAARETGHSAREAGHVGCGQDVNNLCITTLRL